VAGPGIASSRFASREGGSSRPARLASGSAPKTAVLPRRAFAWVLDSGFVLGMWLFASDALHGPFGLPLPGEVNEVGWTENLRALAILCAIWPACGLAYYTLFEGLLGFTPGKLLFGLRILKRDGPERPGLARAFVRSAARLVDGAGFYLVGWTLALSFPQRQRLGDRLAGTFVVRCGSAPPSVATGRLRNDSEEAFVPAQPPPEVRDYLRRLEVGRAGEEAVAASLAHLSEKGYYLFNNLRASVVGDIDHLLVGPAGVFVIETKSHKGRVTQDGETGELLRDGAPFERDPVKQSRLQGSDVSKRVFGARRAPLYRFVCFTRAEVETGPGRVYPPGVCALKDLERVVASKKVRLAPQEVRFIAERVASAYGKPPDNSPPTERWPG
jgi:uncharacterized RDD family membrane protein YckC